MVYFSNYSLIHFRMSEPAIAKPLILPAKSTSCRVVAGGGVLASWISHSVPSLCSRCLFGGHPWDPFLTTESGRTLTQHGEVQIAWNPELNKSWNLIGRIGINQGRSQGQYLQS